MSERKRFFYDTEFIEDGSTIDLISIGVVCEDGREFYAQSLECDFLKASEWVARNVFPHLGHFHPLGRRNCSPATGTGLDTGIPTDGGRCRDRTACPWLRRSALRDELRAFVGDARPEWWGYYSAYDHVALCQIFGRMVDLPEGWPFFTRDLAQWAKALGADLRAVPAVGPGHNALADAKWNRAAFDYLAGLEARPVVATTERRVVEPGPLDDLGVHDA